MTPYQLYLVMTEYNDKVKEETQVKLRLAYLNAVWTSRFVWAKKIPSFEEVTKTKNEMTDKQMLNVVKQLNARFKGKTGG